MKKIRVFEVELQRSNVTPAQFLAYVRSRVDKKGGRYIRSDLDLKYFAAGNDLNFDIKHIDDPNDGLHEKSISKPYEMQTYLAYPDGSKYNEICEFEFGDDKTGNGYYYLLNVEVYDDPSADYFDVVKEEVKKETRLSAWSKGVEGYALDLVDELKESISGGWNDMDVFKSDDLLNRALLNGAENWDQYSWGGCALIYDTDIAKALCSPSELARCNGGAWRPNSREEWLDVQARALKQAARRIRTAVHKVNELV